MNNTTGKRFPAVTRNAAIRFVPKLTRLIVTAKNCVVLLALLLLPVGVSYAAESGVTVPAFERVQMPNGAVLLLMERHDVPLISFAAVMRGGALTDPARESGMASLLAGLLEKGAGKRDAGAFADTLASVGGMIATDSEAERISVDGSFLARDQSLMIELLADILQRPRLDRAQFSALQARYIEFIRSAKDSDLESLAPIYGRAALFRDHPYGRPSRGSEATLGVITYEDLQRYYKEQFGSDRLVLTVVGDFSVAKMKQALNAAFAGWHQADAALPKVAAPTGVSARRVVLVDAPDSVQSYFWAGNLGVARSFPARAALDVVNTLFGGRFTSMLNSELRIRTGLTYGARSRFERLTQPGAWQMSSFTRTEKTIEAIDLAFAVLDGLHRKGIDPTMLASGKAYVQGQFPLALETSGQWAGTLADLEFYGLDRSYIDGYGAALAGVTEQNVRSIIDEQFPTSDHLTLVVIGKASAIRDGLRKYGPVTEMRLSDGWF
ncbi:MAG TPA: pitrilysin family protein [Steroidobacteraceae bacterium]|jgi:predicted Zn-dependent peptidase